MRQLSGQKKGCQRWRQQFREIPRFARVWPCGSHPSGKRKSECQNAPDGHSRPGRIQVDSLVASPTYLAQCRPIGSIDRLLERDVHLDASINEARPSLRLIGRFGEAIVPVCGPDCKVTTARFTSRPHSRAQGSPALRCRPVPPNSREDHCRWCCLTGDPRRGQWVVLFPTRPGAGGARLCVRWLTSSEQSCQPS